jgi:uncharacterized surface protein with fasciclin (FAS1) repeats
MENFKNWLPASAKLVAAAMVSGFLSSCSDDEMPPILPQTVLEIAVANSNFSTLVNAVEEANLTTRLSGDDPVTVFAPTNEGFQDFLDQNGLSADELLANPTLSGILSYHLVAGTIPSSIIQPGAVTTLSGGKFYVSQDPASNLWINGKARVTQADVQGSNGIIHVLDFVLTPPTQTLAEIAVDASQEATPEFTQLVAALSRMNLVEAVNGDNNDNFTVFAPTDAAFQQLYADLGVGGLEGISDELLTQVLLYHVVPVRAFSQDLRQDASLPTLLEGQTLTVDLANLQINDSGLIESSLNILGINGVIHAIDKVLVPSEE